jgi:flagellar biosynthetic protein FliQ
MSITQAMEIGQDTLYTTLLLALPALLASLVIGLLISILQTVTNIQDQTLSFVPRILVVGLVVVVTLGWAMQTALHFLSRVLGYALEAVR